MVRTSNPAGIFIKEFTKTYIFSVAVTGLGTCLVANCENKLLPLDLMNKVYVALPEQMS
jgi:hypothetical protein